MRSWFIVYDKEKNDYFAIEDKHEGVTPKVIGNRKVVGNVSFKYPDDGIDYIRWVEATHPCRRRK